MQSNGQADQFLAKENYQGYSQQLLFETIEKYYPDSTNDGMKLSKMLELPDTQRLLRDAAVSDSARKLEQHSKMAREMVEPLDDPSYCSYYWLSWLPWLDCPPESRETSFIMFSNDICTPPKRTH